MPDAFMSVWEMLDVFLSLLVKEVSFCQGHEVVFFIHILGVWSQILIRFERASIIIFPTGVAQSEQLAFHRHSDRFRYGGYIYFFHCSLLLISLKISYHSRCTYRRVGRWDRSHCLSQVVLEGCTPCCRPFLSACFLCSQCLSFRHFYPR